MDLPNAEEASEFLKTWLAAPERDPDTLRYEGMMGLLYAMAAAPVDLDVTEWMPLVFGEEEPLTAGLDRARVLSAILVLFDAVERQVLDGVPELPPSCRARRLAIHNLGPETPLGRWSGGFLVGHEWLLDVWADSVPESLEPQFDYSTLVLAFFADEEAAAAMAEALPPGEEITLEALAEKVVDALPDALRDYARIGLVTRALLASIPIEPARSDKIGRNEPCPCGSGKKYKKCCGA